MAGRNLEELKKRYNSSSSKYAQAGPGGRGPGRGPGGPGGRGAMHSSSKPKNTKAAIKRLFSYISAFKGRMIVVLFCMAFSTASHLIAGYMLRPVINNVADNSTSVEDRIRYLAVMVFVLLAVYLTGIVSTYFQSRIMLNISQSAIEKLRNE